MKGRQDKRPGACRSNLSFPVEEASREEEWIINEPQAHAVWGPAPCTSDLERKLDRDMPENPDQEEFTGGSEIMTHCTR
jgi:hypothetical protein